MSRKVVVDFNQQQRELLDRLVAEGTHGSTRSQAIATVFHDFCATHPELMEKSGSSKGKR